MSDLWAAGREDLDSDDELAEDIRRFRGEDGLPADEATVAWFLAEFRAGRHEGGMWETEAEATVRRRDDERIRRAWDAIDPYLEGIPDVLAGRWRGRGRGRGLGVHVALTTDLDRHCATMLRRLPEPELLHVHRAEHSLAELHAIQDEITDDETLAEAGIEWRGCGTDEIGNRVTLEAIAPDREAAARVVAERYGSAVELDYLGPDATVVEPQPWQLYSLEGLALTVHYHTNATYEPAGARLVETDDEVRVTVLERVPVGSVKLPGATRQETVTLREPLGERPVVDGHAGRTRRPRNTAFTTG